MSDLACPTCGTELDMAALFAHETDHRAIARLIAVSVPIGARVLAYITLFTPPKTRLTAAKKIKLVLQLLPDLERCAVTHRGREWAAPLAAWAQAIDQMLATRDAGRLDLPMKNHVYLYTILMGLADKAEGSAEAQANAERFQAARAGPGATPAGGVPVIASAARQFMPPHADPALAKIAADAARAAPMPAATREKIAALRGAATPANPTNPQRPEDTPS